MDKNKRLPPKLEAVLVELVRNNDLNVTQAVKMPYLVDVVARHVLGRRITEGRHQTWQHGVVTAQAWRHLTRAAKAGSPFRVEPVPWSEERKVSVDEGVEVAELSDEERQIVAFVRDQFKTTWAVELGRITKRMNPQTASWGSKTNREADTGEDAYDRMTASYQEMVARVESLTPAQLRNWVEIEDIEEAIA